MAQREKPGGPGELAFAERWPVRGPGGLRHGFRPNLDCYHTDDPHELTVVVEVPGVDPRSLTIAIEERMLVISGERPRARAERRVYQQVEIEYGPFERRLHLSEDVDLSQARARYEQGMVTISLPIGTPASRGRHAIVVEGL